MKYLKNIVAVLALASIFHLSYSAELSVDTIEVIDVNTISVTLSENPNLEVGELDGEIKVLNDVKIRGALASQSQMNQAELILEDPIIANTTYSLLTVLGDEGSISFTTPAMVEGYTATNIEGTLGQDIDSIEIIDDRTILIRYREEITSPSLEYKLLAESDVTLIEKPDFYMPEIILTVEPPLNSEKDYILMFIEMQDASGEFLEFDTGIYDFVTPVLDEMGTAEPLDDTIGENSQEYDEMLEVLEIENEVEASFSDPDVAQDLSTNQEEIDLNAAGEETGLVKDTEMIDTDTAAEMLTETPDTGAQTWVLILATIVINSFYYLSRRKKLSVAS